MLKTRMITKRRPQSALFHLSFRKSMSDAGVAAMPAPAPPSWDARQPAGAPGGAPPPSPAKRHSHTSQSRHAPPKQKWNTMKLAMAQAAAKVNTARERDEARDRIPAGIRVSDSTRVLVGQLRGMKHVAQLRHTRSAPSLTRPTGAKPEGLVRIRPAPALPGGARSSRLESTRSIMIYVICGVECRVVSGAEHRTPHRRCVEAGARGVSRDSSFVPCRSCIPYNFSHRSGAL